MRPRLSFRRTSEHYSALGVCSGAMTAQASPERLFLDNLALIDRVAASFGRRLGLRGDDAADFASLVRLKLVEDDYAAVRKFRGESSLATYLTVVIAMFARDYRVARWGRWRPSSAARRLGGVAMRLEMLVNRDGLQLHQAGEALRTSGETNLSDGELGRVIAQLPRRAPLRPTIVGEDSLADVPAVVTAGEPDALESALEDAVGALPLEDRMIVRMRFWEGLNLATIARALSLEQKPLYRRVERLLDTLRRQLEADGIDREQVRQLLEVRS